MPICIPCQKEKLSSYFSNKTYVVGTQMNRYVKNNGEESIYNFTLKMFVYLNLWKCVEKVT